MLCERNYKRLFRSIKKTTGKLDRPISGPVKAGTVDPRMFKLKPLSQEAIKEIGKQLDDYTEKKKDFGVW